MSTPSPTRSIAIYTRYCCEEGLEQEFHDIDAQREAALAYIRQHRYLGGVTILESFDDGDYTGGNMERPALQRLLRQIGNGKIDCVVVYSIEILTCSLHDLARLMAYFMRYHIDLVSVTWTEQQVLPGIDTALICSTDLDFTGEESDSFRANTEAC